MNPQADSVLVRAPAKINLCLHIGAKRSDGFHDLQSLVVFAEHGDDLYLTRADELTLVVDGPFSNTLPIDDDNLALRAVRIFSSIVGKPPLAHIRLTKNLPVASGIGGGSADAAAVLRGLRTIWNLARAGDDILWGEPEPFANRTESLAAASAIGSDVPVCLLSAPALMEGRGERVWSLDSFPDAALVLVNPGVAVSTADVFRRLDRRTGANEMIPSGFGYSVEDLVAYLSETANDLEAPALSIAPCIGDVLEALRASGALFARMSGSGATCFGIFKNKSDADKAGLSIEIAHPEWWVRSTRIASPDIGRPRPVVQ